jgi:hypothetical protein
MANRDVVCDKGKGKKRKTPKEKRREEKRGEARVTKTRESSPGRRPGKQRSMAEFCLSLVPTGHLATQYPGYVPTTYPARQPGWCLNSIP